MRSAVLFPTLLGLPDESEFDEDLGHDVDRSGLRHPAGTVRIRHVGPDGRFLVPPPAAGEAAAPGQSSTTPSTPKRRAEPPPLSDSPGFHPRRRPPGGKP